MWLPRVNRKAFTALLVGSIMAVMVGAILLVISYVVIGAIQGAVCTTTGPMGATGTSANVLNASYVATQGAIIQALNIIGISLIVVGVAGIIYMLIGLGGVGAGGRR